MCIFNPVSNNYRVILLEQYIGSIVHKNQNEAVIALENGLYCLKLDTEKLTLINEQDSHLPNNRFNDGKCDANGRF